MNDTVEGSVALMDAILHRRAVRDYSPRPVEKEIIDKLLFGSDYSFTTVNASVDGLRKLNDMLEGTKLPRLDPGRLEGLIHGDGLAKLGLE